MTDSLMWLYLATGFTGALTGRFVVRQLLGLVRTPDSIAAYHSPKGGCTDAVVRELKRARREVLVLAYSFSSKPIAEALVEAKGRGVDVQIVLDKSNETESYSELPDLQKQGFTPLIDAHHAIAHNKVMLIDRSTLITGSFNFTYQAEHENAENLLIIKGHSELLAAYRANIMVHKGHAHAPGTASELLAAHRANFMVHEGHAHAPGAPHEGAGGVTGGHRKAA